jgi:hypothetical protein
MFEHQLFDYSIILILTLFTNICYLSFSTPALTTRLIKKIQNNFLF